MAKKRKLLQQKQKQKQKTNKQPRPGAPHKSAGTANKGPNTKTNAQAEKAEAKSDTQSIPQRDLAPTIPFSPSEDAILLVGEGDLSFSRALVEHHYCENVTATVLEAKLEELTEKYPHVQENVDIIEGDGSKIIYNVDAKKMGPWSKKSGKDSAGIFDRISTQITLRHCRSTTPPPSPTHGFPQTVPVQLTPLPQSIQLPSRRRQVHRRKPAGALQPRAPGRVFQTRPAFPRPRRDHRRHTVRGRALHPLEHPRSGPSLRAAGRAELPLPGVRVSWVPPREDTRGSAE